MVGLFGQDSLHGYGVHGDLYWLVDWLVGGGRTGCRGREERREMILKNTVEGLSKELERMKEFFFCDALISPFSLVPQLKGKI